MESFLNRFEAPKLVDKLDAKLQKKIGEEVVIELFKFWTDFLFNGLHEVELFTQLTDNSPPETPEIENCV